jgi:hypothetical protein
VNVGEILTELYRDLEYEDVPPASITTRLKGYVQRAYVQILREPDLSQLRDTLAPLVFTSVLNQSIYGLPSQISRVVAITDRVNNRLLTPISLVELRLNDPGLTATGTPWAWVPIGYGPAQTVPASTGIWVASTSAADAATVTAQVNGVRANGLPTGDLVAALNGVTRVPVGTVTDLVDVQGISVTSAAPTAGTITFSDAAVAGNVIAQIAPGRTAPRYFRVQLYPIPDAGQPYSVDGQMHVPDLDDAEDVPLLPPDFHSLLVTGALIHEYKRKDDQARIVTLLPDWQVGIARLKHAISATATDIPVKGQPVAQRFSRFGAWTPSDW